MRRRPLLVGWVLPAFLAVFLALSFHSKVGFSNRSVGWHVEDHLDRLAYVHEVLKERYVEPLDTTQLFDDALRGMLDSLDPYTEYYTPEEFKELKENTKGEFGGIGVEVTKCTGEYLKVITPFQGTPAWEAGLEPGDWIISVEGESTKPMRLQDCVNRLRGTEGSVVTIEVRHGSDSEPVEVALTRAIIHIESVKGMSMVDGRARIGYVRITKFLEDTAGRLRSAINLLLSQNQGLRGLVLDLRFNGGGLMQTAVDIADMFLEKGQIIVTTRGRVEEENCEIKATGEKTMPRNLRLAVLVNAGSASASEILAGSLQSNGRAVVVGERSYGKASVQVILEIPLDQSGVKVTTAKYFTPSGQNIHREEHATTWGITPDREVSQTEQQLRQLRKFWEEQELVANGHAEAVEPASGEEETPFVDQVLRQAVEELKKSLPMARPR